MADGGGLSRSILSGGDDLKSSVRSSIGSSGDDGKEKFNGFQLRGSKLGKKRSTVRSSRVRATQVGRIDLSQLQKECTVTARENLVARQRALSRFDEDSEGLTRSKGASELVRNQWGRFRAKFARTKKVSLEDKVKKPSEDSRESKFRRNLQKIMVAHPFGHFWDLTNIIFSGLSSIMYVWETYNVDLAPTFESVDIFFSSFFAIDYLLRVYLADRRLAHIFKPTSIVDLLTILPILLVPLDVPATLETAAEGFRVFIVLRMMRINDFIVSMMDSEVNQRLTILITNIITAAFFSAGLIRIFENEYRYDNGYDTLTFAETLYFVIVTISTVGYGDISPMSGMARFCVAMLICTALIYIPKATNALIALMSRKSIYQRRSFRPGPHVPYVVVCGSIDIVGATAFLTELFHEDHGNVDLHAVLLCEDLPSPAMENLLNNPQYRLSVTYLQGSPLSVQDLMRASVLGAAACFLLCNKFSDTPDQEDAATILRALSIKRFVLQCKHKDMLTCLQLLREENRQHFTLSHQIMMSEMQEEKDPKEEAPEEETMESAGGNNGGGFQLGGAILGKRYLASQAVAAVAPFNASSSDKSSSKDLHALGKKEPAQAVLRPEEDPIICVNELKMNLLAQACLCPGIMTMVGNLIMSVDDTPLKPDTPEWLKEYSQGSAFEIYRTKLSSAFEGVPFCVAAQLVHAEIGALMFGIELRADGFSRVIMNPAKLKIPSVNEYDVHCFVIAEDLESAELSSFDNYVEPLDDGKLKELGVKNGKPSVPVSSSKTASFKTTFGVETFRARRNSRVEEYLSIHNLVKSLAAEATAQDLSSLMSPGGGNGSNGDVGNVNAADENTTEARVDVEKKAKRGWGIVKGNIKGQSRSDALRAEESKSEEQAEAEIEESLFYKLRKPRSLSEVTVLSSLHDNFPAIRDHVVICGNLSGLLSLIRTLRSKHLVSTLPIVILNPEPPNPILWSKISIFPFIFYVQGSSNDKADLRRAGIRYASRAIVLAASANSSQVDQTFNDAQAIFAHQGAIGMNPDIQIVTEIVSTGNVGFLDIGGSRKRRQDSESIMSSTTAKKFHSAPQFIAGIVFSSSMLDTLISQSFYNPHITMVFQQLISGSKASEQGANTQDSLSKRAQFIKDVKQSYLFQIPVPKKFNGASYGEMFRTISQDWGMVPLGLLRSVTSPFSEFNKGNPVPYVFTNPSSDVLLSRLDKVFVLSSEAPSSQQLGKSLADVISEMASLNKRESAYNENDKKFSSLKMIRQEGSMSDAKLKEMSSELTEVKRMISELQKTVRGADSLAAASKGRNRKTSPGFDVISHAEDELSDLF